MSKSTLALLVLLVLVVSASVLGILPAPVRDYVNPR